MIETAVALAMFVALVLGTVDLAYGIFRYHVLAQSARQIARQAIVHGSLADDLGPWGPDSISARATDPGVIPEMIAPSLVGWDLSQVEIQVDWLDGGNDPEQGHRVRVRMAAPYEPIMTFLFARSSVQLSASSTMRIAH